MSINKHKIHILMKTGAIALGAMYVINRILSSSAISKNILSVELGDFYKWKFGPIYYSKIGSGSPILLIHDLHNASSSFEWGQIALKLSKNHTVYSIDLPGCGRSAKPALKYTNFMYVQLISDFIKDIIGERTDVAATGLSASFVTMASVLHKEKIGRIIMVNPWSIRSLEQTPSRKSRILFTLACIPVIGNSIYHIKSARQNIEYLLTEKYMFNPFRIQQKTLDAYHEAAHHGFGKGKYLMASLDGHYLTVNMRNALKKTESPMTILIGDKLESGREVADSYKKINGSISISSILNTKMLPQLEDSDITCKAIEEALS